MKIIKLSGIEKAESAYLKDNTKTLREGLKKKIPEATQGRLRFSFFDLSTIGCLTVVLWDNGKALVMVNTNSYPQAFGIKFEGIMLPKIIPFVCQYKKYINQTEHNKFDEIVLRMKKILTANRSAA